jgi:hypothetical protein
VKNKGLWTLVGALVAVAVISFILGYVLMVRFIL